MDASEAKRLRGLGLENGKSKALASQVKRRIELGSLFYTYFLCSMASGGGHWHTKAQQMQAIEALLMFRILSFDMRSHAVQTLKIGRGGEGAGLDSNPRDYLSSHYDIIGIAALLRRLHPPVNQHKKPDTCEHDQLPPATFTNVVQAARTHCQCGEQQAQTDQRCKGFTQHGGSDRHQDLKQKEPPELGARCAA